MLKLLSQEKGSHKGQRQVSTASTPRSSTSVDTLGIFHPDPDHNQEKWSLQWLCSRNIINSIQSISSINTNARGDGESASHHLEETSQKTSRGSVKIADQSTETIQEELLLLLLLLSLLLSLLLITPKLPRLFSQLSLCIDRPKRPEPMPDCPRE